MTSHPSQSDAALLSSLLDPGGLAPSRCTELLEELGGLAALGRTSQQRLREAGMSAAQARRAHRLTLFASRLQAARLEEKRLRLGSYDAVVQWARERLALLAHEEMWLVSLDGCHGVIATHCVARGGRHGCAVTPADILRCPLADGAAAFVLVHNHPSGSPCPSREDLAMTRAVAAAAELVGIPLVDHVIVAREGDSSVGERL